MPFNHHGHEICDIIYRCAPFNGFSEYLDSRLIETDLIKAYSHMNNHVLQDDERNEGDDIGLVKVSEMKPLKKTLVNDVFKQEKN